VESFAGRVAVVTGGGSGIGYGMCLAFARAGMRVAVADIEEEAAARTAARLADSGARAIAVRTDVSERKAVEALADRCERELGGVDLVCNNAGVFTGGDMLQSSESDWAWCLGVNVMGVVHGSQVFAPRLVAQGSGQIVNTASVGGFLAQPSMSIYCTTKFAVVGFSEALRAHLAPAGVGVSTLCPGPIRTQLASSERLRPGGPDGGASRSEILAPMIADGMPPEQVGEIVLRGVRENAEYIFTHTLFRELFEQKFARVAQAFDAVGD